MKFVTYHILFHILIDIFDYFAIIHRKQCDYVIDCRMYKMFSWVIILCTVFMDAKQKKTEKRKIFCKNVAFLALISTVHQLVKFVYENDLVTSLNK